MPELIAIAVGLVIILAALVILHPLRLRRRVLVVLLDDSGVAGILWGRRGPYLVLRSASIVSSGESVPADGEVVLHRSQVRYVQVLAS